MDTESKKDDVASYMRLMCEKGLTTSSGGNISVRGGNDQIYITPSGPGKESLRRSDILTIKLDGSVSGDGDLPSIESPMHLMIYEYRTDVNAVIHAHPLFTTAFLCTEREIDFALTTESKMLGDSAVEVEFDLAGSMELASSVSTAARSSSLILMRNHGVVALGRSLRSI